MSENVYILGVGMTPFSKPNPSSSYTHLALHASSHALLDAGLTYDSVDRAVACYCYGDSTSGQRVLYPLGMTGVPIYNVNNNCSTGSTGIAMARDFLRTGLADCVLVVGFEKMYPGSLKGFWEDRESPLGPTVRMVAATRGLEAAPINAQMFGNAGKEYIEK
jgi:sterol carrier protein 2